MDSKFYENLAKAQELADRINSNIADIQNILEYSYRLIEKSHKALDRADKIILLPFNSSTAHFSKGQR